MTHRFPDALEPIDGANGGQDVGRIGPLPPPCLEQLALPKGAQHQVEELLLSPTGHQPAPELRQHRGIEAWIVEFQGQCVLPVDMTADRIGCLLIREPLDILHNGDQGQSPRGFGGLTATGKERRKVLIAVDGAKLVAHPHKEVPLPEGGTSDAGGVGGNGWNSLGMEAHGEAPWRANKTVEPDRVPIVAPRASSSVPPGNSPAVSLL